MQLLLHRCYLQTVETAACAYQKQAADNTAYAKRSKPMENAHVHATEGAVGKFSAPLLLCT